VADEFLPTPWGAELVAENAEFASSVLDHLLPAVVQMHRADAARLGLDPTELAILEVLRVVDPLSISALAGRISLSHAATARAVGRLEDRQWVARNQDPHDGRGWLVFLSPETRTLLQDARARVRHRLAEVADDMSPERRIATLHALVQVTDRVARSARDQAEQRWREIQYRRWQERHRTSEDGR
jgi:DNA-binding MarR family transcriptional regulator